MSPPQRGVYELTYYDAAGDRLAVAISHDGRELGRMPFRPGTREQAITALHAVLAAADPLPVLRVV
jgi:hypothetical protein